MAEFDVIERFFKPLASEAEGLILGIGDDCALLELGANEQLAISMDLLIAGRHFPEDTAAYDIGWKAAAVNMSDLAAMGATPRWLTLGLALPDVNEAWLSDFCRGFADVIKPYGVALVGGDTTKGPLSIAVQAHGLLKKGQALRRDGAKVGDGIYVTGPVGGAALGLKMALGELEKQAAPLQRLNRPVARIEHGLECAPFAHAAIDISDGLLQDLGHICTASNLGAQIDVAAVPLQDELKNHPEAYEMALGGGDDYELLLCMPDAAAAGCSLPLYRIGHMCEAAGLHCTLDGMEYKPTKTGFDHFE